MGFEVKKAKRQRRPLKIGLEGLSGSGKTYTALRLAFAMRRAGIGKRIVVADSENESAGLYDGVHIDGETWQYETCAIPHESQNPVGYTEVYEYLVAQGYDIIIIDSMTHAWKGALNRVDEIGARNKGDKFGSGWRVVTPEQERMMQVLTNTRAHLITTTRVKGDYEHSTEGGKTRIKKVAMKADQRDGLEYEYDCVVRLDNEEHIAVVEKVRGCTLMDGKSGKRPGPEFWQPLFAWWLSAEAVVPVVDTHLAAISAATTIDALKAVMGAANADAKAKRLTDEEVKRLADAKDARKLAIEQADKLKELSEMAADGPPLDGDDGTGEPHESLFANGGKRPAKGEVSGADAIKR